MSQKAILLQRIRKDLRQQLDRLRAAASEAHAAATDPGSKAESKYDTRSLEASYLASGQARQVEAMSDALDRLDQFEAPDFGIEDAVGPGALVETDLDGETEWFLLLPAGGGHVVEDQGREITLLSPSSRLYQELCDRHLGDTLDDSGHLVTEIA
ncbi:transcription elongation factor greAB [Haloferula helveola]|uniref:Transcription elongation factor greAB n=1 Tax=Haloferula helveola TaxID=490095 RepID=A0ABM7RID3_9BACT|nr:transcription elongation factor greAB [Haloferula helveola]